MTSPTTATPVPSTAGLPEVAVGQRRGQGAGLTIALISAASFGLSGSLARSLLDLGWTPGAATLPYELVHGTLRRPIP